VHLTGIVVVFIAIILGRELVAYGSLILSMGILLISVYTQMRVEIKEKLPLRVKSIEILEETLYEVLNSLEREEYIKKKPYLGAFTFYFSIGLVMLVFPLEISALAVTVLAVHDSFSTLIGYHFGRYKIPGTKKTWEGFFGGLIPSFLVCALVGSFLGLPILYIIIAPVVGAVVEVYSFGLNDNITIPIMVGFILLLV